MNGIEKGVRNGLNINAEPLIEMARINLKDDGRSFFPYNSWEVKIWSNDHTPPHFHIIKDGWDVSFIIESGDLYRIDKKGQEKSIYNYMIDNVKKWLEDKCALLPMVTNKENAMSVWEENHDF